MHTFNPYNFDAEVIQESEKLVVVDFWAQWCGPCRTLAPILEEIEAELGDKIKIGKVDIGKCPELATEWHVNAIPTIMVFKNGEVQETFVGMHPKGFLIENIKAVL